MEIRRDKAAFLDSLLKLFGDVRKIRKKDLEIKYAGDSYLFVQTEKHLKILEADGMIKCNVLAKHKIAEAEYEEMEEDDDEIFI